jgi:RNA polymerase-binding protein DksA
MQKALLEKYKQKLIELEDRLDDEVHRLINAIPDEVNSPGELSNVPTHNADRDVELFETDVEIIRNEQDLHAKVHEALARIEDGTYGTCQRCGRAISHVRLDAVPYAPYCKECAEILEKEEGTIKTE